MVDLSGYHICCAGCVPYSQAACEAAVDRLGLKKDENFVLTSSCADIMGCMAYNGRAWYRPGGTESQIKSNAECFDEIYLLKRVCTFLRKKFVCIRSIGIHRSANKYKSTNDC